MAMEQRSSHVLGKGHHPLHLGPVLSIFVVSYELLYTHTPPMKDIGWHFEISKSHVLSWHAQHRHV